MKKFIVDLFSNRFGIVLAGLNLCYFAGKSMATMHQPFGTIFGCANFPAAISSLLSVEFIKIFAHTISFTTEIMLAKTFFAVFIALQWLFIAWISRTLARKLRPREL